LGQTFDGNVHGKISADPVVHNVVGALAVFAGLEGQHGVVFGQCDGLELFGV
jgi:hypothetical protein